MIVSYNNPAIRSQRRFLLKNQKLMSPGQRKMAKTNPYMIWVRPPRRRKKGATRG